MTSDQRLLIQHRWADRVGKQVVDYDLSEYSPGRLAALRVAGYTSEVGPTISVYVSMYLAGLEHVLAMTGDVALTGDQFRVEFLPWARPVRMNDLIHIVPIWAPLLIPDMTLHIVANANTGDIRVNEVLLLMEPLRRNDRGMENPE